MPTGARDEWRTGIDSAIGGLAAKSKSSIEKIVAVP
jgi:hypothetical protein